MHPVHGVAAAAVLGLCSTIALAQPASTISDGERAAASWAVQNVISRHDYLHALELNDVEVDTDWVSPAGVFAATATFCLVQICEHGMDTIVNAYAKSTGQKNTDANRKKMAAIDPNIKDTHEYDGAGDPFYQHTNSTPIIEIAGDGKTAKGVWYTPGIDIAPVIEDGKVHLRAGMSWQKLAVDFVKENGRWKIWHMLVAMDANLPLTREQVATLVGKAGDIVSPDTPKPAKAPANAREMAVMLGGSNARPGAFQQPKYVYPQWSPERTNKVWPPLPEPYISFANTFSYCNCDQELPDALK